MWLLACGRLFELLNANLTLKRCRYLLYEVVWKDNKADESISKTSACKLSHQLQDFPRFADEAALLAIFRESLLVNFGDHGVARSAMSLSGYLQHLCSVAWCMAQILGFTLHVRWCSQVLQSSDKFVHASLRHRRVQTGALLSCCHEICASVEVPNLLPHVTIGLVCCEHDH